MLFCSAILGLLSRVILQDSLTIGGHSKMLIVKKAFVFAQLWLTLNKLREVLANHHYMHIVIFRLGFLYEYSWYL